MKYLIFSKLTIKSPILQKNKTHKKQCPTVFKKIDVSAQIEWYISWIGVHVWNLAILIVRGKPVYKTAVLLDCVQFIVDIPFMCYMQNLHDT